jgi:hypothetical protein
MWVSLIQSICYKPPINQPTLFAVENWMKVNTIDNSFMELYLISSEWLSVL